ncbi:MAG: phenylacetate--CoA ligase family protein [Solirubrobacterales bacterium]|nr:phenylacetate--CoA ligase family protein [Solirubrobacterales bacterium]
MASHPTHAPTSTEALAPRRDELARATVATCYERSSYYRSRLQDLGVEPGDIAGVADLERLPVLLGKEDERELQERSRTELGHPFGEHLCVDAADVVAVASTSGTTGTPTFYAFTAEDVAVTDELWGRALTQAGVTRESVVLQAFGLSMFLAGVPLVRAVERLGAQIVPVGAEAGTERLLNVARLVRPTVILCTPSYARYLIEKAPDAIGELGLRSIVCAGEPGAGLPEVREAIEAATGATVYDALGGAHGIMNASTGAHPYDGMVVLGDDCSVQQLVDPDTREPVPVPDDGRPAYGERVKTTLRWRAQPQLRSSVGDVYEMRRVGDTTRIKVIGRTDDLLIVKGVKLYPAAARDLIAGFAPRASGEFRIVLHGPPPRVEPPLRLKVERGGTARQDEDARLAADIARAMHDRLSVRPEIEVVAAGALERTSHKTRYVELAGER